MAEVNAAIAGGAKVVFDAGAVSAASTATPTAAASLGILLGLAAPIVVTAAGAGLVYAYWKLDVWGYWFEHAHLLFFHPEDRANFKAMREAEYQREARQVLSGPTPLPTPPPLPPEIIPSRSVTKIELPADPSSPTFQGAPAPESGVMSFPTEKTEPALAPSDGSSENAYFPPAEPDRLPVIAPAENHTNTSMMGQRLTTGENDPGIKGRRDAETTSTDLAPTAQRAATDSAKVDQGKANVKKALGDQYEAQVKIIEGWPEEVQQRFYQNMAGFNPEAVLKSRRTRIMRENTGAAPSPPSAPEYTNPAKDLREEVLLVDEYFRSLSEPINPNRPWRRIQATPREAAEFYNSFKPTVHGEVVIAFEGTNYVIDRGILQKMERWAMEHSHGLQIETRGWFQYRREGNRVIIEDFIPSASYSESLWYPRRTRGQGYGEEGQMSAKALAPNRVMSYFADFDVDPKFYKEFIYGGDRARYLNFHSHFTASCYQQEPSPEDYKSYFREETRLLWTPGEDPEGRGGHLIIFRASSDEGVRTHSTYGLPND